MDKYIKIKSIKKNSKIFGQKNLINVLENVLKNNETICVYGDTGSGKTHIVEHVLHGTQFIKLSQDILTSKNSIDEYFSRIIESDHHIFIDDIDCEILGIKEISERKKISNGALIITCKNIEKINFCNCIQVEKLSNEDLMKLAKFHYPKKDGYEVDNCIKNFDGNVSNFIFSLGFSHSKDIFKQPKELVCDLICHNSTRPETPMNYIGHVIPEHGYSSAMIHENYPDGVSSIDDAVKVIDNISRSDIIDMELYKGNWDYSDYYNLHGIIKPAKIINHGNDINKIRPGSVWTKFNNFRMRQNKLIDIARRTRGLGINELVLLGKYCQHRSSDVIPLLLSYGIINSDIDVINHISLRKKIKTKTTQEIKRKLKLLYT